MICIQRCSSERRIDRYLSRDVKSEIEGAESGRLWKSRGRVDDSMIEEYDLDIEVSP